MFNFYEYFKNIDAFAVVDIIIFVLVLALLTVFYVRKKQLNVLLIFLALVAVGLALNIVSYVFGGTVLTAARIIIFDFVLRFCEYSHLFKRFKTVFPKNNKVGQQHNAS